MHLTLITSNDGKFKDLKKYLEPEITVERISTPYLEMRSDDPKEITKLAAKQNAEKLNKPVIVEDSGLFIKGLNDFPGTCSAYIHKRIGLKGILRLMEGIEDRTCSYKSAVGYCEPGKEPLSFFGEEKGKIATEEKGSHGFGHDPIFIPDNSDKSYGELGEEFKKFRRFSVNKLKEYLMNKEK